MALAPSLRAEPPSGQARAPVTDHAAMLSFSISEYFLAPAALWSRNLVLRQTVFAPRLTFARLVEAGGLEVRRKDLPLDLGALGLELAAGLGLTWVVAGMLPSRLPTQAAPGDARPRDAGPRGIEIHPIFATVAGVATLGVVGTF